MKYHLDRKIVFSDQSELKNLYKWCLQEQDDAGAQVGRDYIPWEWTLFFKAKTVTLHESVSIGDRYASEDDPPGAKTRRFIKARLYSDSADSYPPSFSMFGTDRKIEEIDLFIEEADSGGERCMGWAGVSSSSEHDLRGEVFPDALNFYFYVSGDKFGHYAARIASGETNALTFRVGHVKGFYANWSPDIFTRHVKVLTKERQHVVEKAREDVSLPRVGEVEEAEIHFSHTVDMPVPHDPYDESTDLVEIEPDASPAERAAQLEAARDRRAHESLRMIISLRMAAWVIIVLLLVLILVERH